MSSFALSSQDEELLTSLFTMLNECIEIELTESADWVEIIKLELEIHDIPSIQDIPSFIANPQVIKAFITNKTHILESYNLIKEMYDNATFLTLFFTMLNKCIIDLIPINYYLISLIKESFEIDTIPSLQDIPTFIANPLVLKTFSKNIDAILYYNKLLKKDYEDILAKEKWIKEHSIMFTPLYYEPLVAFNFGSVRQPNSFDQHFIRNSPSSMLLLLDLHGVFVSKTPKVMKDIFLNKYSNSAPGQCTGASRPARKYIAYALSDAVASGGIIDVPTILKEGFAHSKLSIMTEPVDDISLYFEKTESNKDRVYNSELTRIETSTVQRSGKVGEEITQGNSFFEKEYELDTSVPYGVFLCKEWDSIEGNILDNLLANPFFILFMNNKYEPEKLWVKKFYPLEYGPYTFVRSRYLSDTGEYPQLYKPKNDIGNCACIIKFVSRDLFEFCQKYGRPEINLIDTSCSIFRKNILSSTYPTHNELYDLFNRPENATVAKGTRKGKKRKSRKCKGSRKGKEKRCNKKILTAK